MNHHRRRSIASLIVLALFGATMTMATQTQAADEGAAVSWSVVPADESGPDGRVAVEHELDPGEQVTDRIAVRNLGTEEVTFRLSSADGFYNDNGRFDMLPSDQASVDAGTWIEIDDSVTVPAGDTIVVPFTVTVPQDAEPGDHAAGVAASVLSVQQDDGGTGVGVESRVGVRVLTRVTGELRPTYEVRQVETKYDHSWNPFRPGNATVRFEVTNTGNARLDIAGVLDIAGQSVQFPGDDSAHQMLLPGESRSFALRVNSVWPLFKQSGQLRLDPSALSFDGDDVAVEERTTQVSLWTIPWSQLLLLVCLVLVVIAVRQYRIRARKKMENLLEQARAEVRAELRSED